MSGPRTQSSPARSGGAFSSRIAGFFQLVEYRRQRIGGALFVHARLRANRPSGATVVGVFQMAEPEWDEFVGRCEVLGIEVTSEEIVE